MSRLIIGQSQEASHRNIFVNGFPTNPDTTANQFPLLALLISSIEQTWEPFKRSTNLAPIGKTHMYTFYVKIYAFRQCCFTNDTYTPSYGVLQKTLI